MSIVLRLQNYSGVPEHIPEEEIPYYKTFMEALYLARENASMEEQFESADKINRSKAVLRVLDIEDVMQEYMEIVCIHNWETHLEHLPDNECRNYYELNEDDREEVRDEFRNDFFCDVSYWYHTWIDEMKEAAYDYNYCFSQYDDDDISDYTNIINSPQVCVFEMEE